MVDFDLTYAPVERHTSVRILICIAAVKQWPLCQIDVGSAFLYTPVDAIIFDEQPHAFEERDGAVCLLKKSLYGIKQAPRLWQLYLHTVLTELGFKQLAHDLGMYRKESRGKFILLVAYADDLLYTGDDTELLDQFEVDIKEKLEVTINHNVTQFLGLKITQSATSIHLSATKYAETLAKKFVVAPINLTTPYRTPPNHESDTTPLSIDDHRLYQRQLGCLLLAGVTYRPDLSYVASQLVQYLKRTEGENLLDLCRALQYFVSTPGVSLTYEASLTSTLQLHGYVDADHAGDIDNRRSRTGSIFQLQPAGLISWNSQKQELISLSSAEAEFIAVSVAVREGLYPMELLHEAKVTMNGHFTLLCDSQSAIKIANKPGFVNRTKHIAHRYFFVKDEINKGKVKLTYCPTGDMAPDFLTKKLLRQKFQHCTNCQRSTGDPRLILGKGYRLVVLGGYGRTDPLLNKPFYPNGLVVGILTCYQSEGLGFKSRCVHFGHPSAGGCQRSTGDPRLILGKGYRLVVLGGYGRTDPLLNKPFYPNATVDKNTSLARKVFRLLKSVNEIQNLLSPAPKTTPLFLVLLGRIKSALLATFLGLDQVVWLGRSGIYQNKERSDLLAKLSLHCWMSSCGVGSVIEVCELYRLSITCAKLGKEIRRAKEKKNATEQAKLKDQLLAALAKARQRQLNFVKSTTDIIVAIGLLQLAPKTVTPRVTGALGFFTSLISCYQLLPAAPSAKSA
ncbi:unnamed protein product [Closterium sp. NIES-53]